MEKGERLPVTDATDAFNPENRRALFRRYFRFLRKTSEPGPSQPISPGLRTAHPAQSPCSIQRPADALGYQTCRPGGDPDSGPSASGEWVDLAGSEGRNLPGCDRWVGT